MDNVGKNKIIDRAIEFIKCNTPQSKLRMAGATIAELELVKTCDLAGVGGNEVALPDDGVKITTEGLMNGKWLIQVSQVKDTNLYDTEVAILKIFGRKKKRPKE